MNVYDANRHLLFIAVPKTASTAVSDALTQQLGYKADTFYARVTNGHMPAAAMRRRLGSDVFDRCNRFAVVRNPYDRFVSACAFLYAYEFKNDPQKTMRQVVLGHNGLSLQSSIVFRPQYTFLETVDGVPVVPRLLRYENLDADFNEWCTFHGHPPTDLPRINGSERDALVGHRTYYHPWLKDMVTDIYRGDLERYGYGF